MTPMSSQIVKKCFNHKPKCLKIIILGQSAKKILILSQSVKNIVTLHHIPEIYFNLKPICPKKIQTLSQYAYAKLVLS